MSEKKITCAICKKWTGHVIVKHLKEAHPKVDAFEYIEEHGTTAFASPHGFALIAKHRGSVVVDRPREEKKVHEIFDLEVEKDEKKNPHRKFVNRVVKPFEDACNYTPPIDENFIFAEQPLKRLLIALNFPERNRVWLHGYAGTGKTQLVTQVAARMNYGLIRINGDTAISRRQLIGDWVVRDGETVFQYGVLVTAMREGHILLVDEIDHLNPPTLAILRGVLEDPSQLVILENGGEVVKAHPNFRVMATANTAGAGDETGLFVTSRALSLADRQRFAIWVRVDYLSPKVETDMIKKRFPKLVPNEIKRFYQVVKAIRDRHKSGELEESFSPRELINWVEKYFIVGDLMEAAQMCFLDRYQNPSVQIAVTEIIKAAFNEQVSPNEIPEEA